MPARHSALIRRKRLGAELRRVRKEAGLTGAELAKQLNWSESKVSRLETARIGLSLADARRFVERLALVGARRDNFLALAEDAANTRGWWHAYRSVITTEQRMVADVEAGASHIQAYASVTLPGLAQTPAYAHGVLQWFQDLGVGASDIDAAVEIRMIRQQVLSGDDPLRYDLILDESVVRRAVGSAEVMTGQWEHLLGLTQRPTVNIRILPLEWNAPTSMAPPGSHAFQVIEFRDSADPPVVCLESLIDLRYLSEVEHLETYRVLFDRMWRSSLDAGQTRDWLQRLVRGS